MLAPERPGRYPATPWAAARLYRPFVAAAITSGLAGAALGASMMVGAVPLSVALELHVTLQLLGWCGLFILGMAMHVIPRFYGNAPIWFPWPQRITLVFIVSGLLLRGAAGAMPVSWLSSVTVATGGVAVAAGLGVACVTLGRVIWARTMPMRPIGHWLWLGLGGAAATSITFAEMSLQQGLSGAEAPDLHLWRTFQSVALHLFILPFAFGIASRSVSALLGLRTPGRVVDRAAAVLVGGGGVALAVGAMGGLAAATGLGMLGIAGGATAHLVGMHLFGRAVNPSPRWFVTYLQVAYAWLGVATVLYAWQALGTLGVMGVATLPGRPELHVLTVGYFSILIVGIASRLLPLFEGRVLRFHGLLAVALVALTLSTAIRTAGAVAPLSPLLYHVAAAMAAAGILTGIAPVAYVLLAQVRAGGLWIEA
ncbi:MAG: hypothetical protein AMXMBFR23_02170 [Chloroflexota bacterium]